MYKSKHNSIRNHMQLHTDERAELVKTDLAAPPTTATSVSWAVDTDGDWSVTSNWSNNKLPTASNSVTLSSPHAHTVTHSIGTDAINSLTSTTDTLAMTGGSLSITTNSAIGGGLAQTGGVLSFKGGASTVSSLTLNDTGEITLAKTATLTATGSVTIGDGIGNYGQISGPGTFITDGATSLPVALSGVGDALIGGGLDWVNASMATVGAILYYSFSGDTVATAITNQTGAVFDLNGDQAAITSYGGGAGTLTNAGTLELTNAQVTDTIAMAIKSTGVISTTGGTLDLTGGGSLGGTVSGAGVLELGAGNFAINSALGGIGTIDIIGGAALVASGVASVSDTLNTLGLIQVAAGGTLSLSGATAFGNGIGSYATLSGPGTLITSGTVTMQDAGAGTGDILLGAGLTWENSGTVNDGALTSLNSVTSDTAAIVNQAGAHFNLTSDDASLNIYNAGTDSFSNAGTLDKTSGTGTDTIQMALTNTGLISVGSGEIALNDGGSLGGTVGGAGTLALTAGNFVVGSSLTGTGNLEASDSSTLSFVTASGSLSVATTVDSSAEILVAHGKSATISGALNFAEPVANYNGAGYLNGPGTLTTSGITTIADAGANGAAFIGGGIVWQNSDVVNVAGDLLFNIVASDTATIDNLAGANFNLTTVDAMVTTYNSGTDLFSNAGTLNKTNGTGTATSVISIALYSTGVINVAIGTLDLTGGATITGTLSGAGTLAVSTGGLNSVGGSLTGNGTLAVYSDAVLTVASGKDFTIANALNFGLPTAIYNGYAELAGPGTLTTTGTVTIADAGANTNLFLGGGMDWINSATINDGGLVSLNIISGDTVTLVNQAGASFNLTSDDGGLVNYNGGTDVFSNAGTLAKTSGTGANTIQMALTSTGLIKIASGEIQLTAGGTLGGSLSGAGILALNGGTFTVGSGFAGSSEMTLGNSAELSFVASSGAVSDSLTVASDGSIDVALGKNASITGALTFSLPTASYTGWGAVEGPGTLTSSGTTTIADSGGNDAMFVGNGATWVNAGTVNDNGLILVNLVGADTATIVNQAGASFNLTTLDSQVGTYNGGTDLFSNAGTLNKASGTGTATSVISIALNNTGTININAGTLDLTGGASLTGSLSGAGTLAISTGTLTSADGTLLGAGTLALYSDATLLVASGKDYTVGTSLVFGLPTALYNGPAYLEGLGTLTTSGITTVGDAGPSSNLYMGGGITWANAGTVNIAGAAYFDPASSDSANILNQASGNFDFTSNDGSLLLYQSGTNLFTNQGTLAKTGGNGLSTMQMALTNSGTVSAATGTLGLTAAVTNTGKMLATSGGRLDLSTAILTNLVGTTLTGGTYEADAGSVIELASNTTVLSDGAVIILSGVGSQIDSLNTSTNKQVTLDSVLTTIKSTGSLTLENGRNFTAGIAGTFTVAGALSLGGVSFTAAKTAINAGGTVSGSGTLHGAITDAGTLLASGGVLTVASAVTGTGALQAASGAIIDLTAGGALSEAISGAGGLQLNGTTAYTLAGATVSIASVAVDAGATLSGIGTLSGTVSNAGTIAATGGTLSITGDLTGSGALQVAAGAVLNLSGGSTFNGSISGAGTVQLNGSDVFVLQSGVTISATSILVGSGAILDLTGGGPLGTDLGGAGVLKLDGTTAYTLAGGSVAVAQLAIDAGATLSGYGNATGAITDAGILSVSGGNFTVQGAVSGAGAMQVAAGDILDLAGGGTLSGAISGAGTVKLDGATALVLQSPASLNAASVVIDAGATLVLTEGGSLAGSLSGAGTLQLDGPPTYSIAAGTDLAIGAVVIESGVTLAGAGTIGGAVSDSGTLSVSSGTLVVGGALSGAGALTIATASTADLKGGGSLTTAISGAGTLQLDGNVAYSLGSGTLSTGGVVIGSGATLSADGKISGTLNDAGTLSVTGGNLTVTGASSGGGAILIATGDVLDLVSGSALSEAISGTGTLKLDNGTYTLGGSTVAAIVALDAGAALSGSGAVSGNLTDLGSVIATSATLALSGGVNGTGALIADAGAVLEISGGGSLTEMISGAGTLQLDNGTYTLGGAGLAVAAGNVDAGAFLAGTGTVSVLLNDAGKINATSGTLVLKGGVTGAGTLAAGAGAVVELTNATALTEIVTGAGTLDLHGVGSYTLAGGTLFNIADLAIDKGAVLAGLGTVTSAVADNGLITANGGKLEIKGLISGTGAMVANTGATLDLATGATLSEAISGGGTLELSGVFARGASALSVNTILLDTGASLSASGTLSNKIVDSGTLMTAGGSLKLTGTLAGKGTLSATTGTTLEVSGGGTFAGALTGAGEILIDKALILAPGASLSAASVVMAANVTLGTAEKLTNLASNNLTLSAAAAATVKLTGAGTDSLTNAGTTLVNGAGTADLGLAVINSGNITASAGTLTFLGAVTNTGTIDASSGLLSFSKSVTGAGTLQVDSAGTLSLLAGSASGQLVDFLSSSGLVELTKPNSFAGSFQNFGGNDKIDLINTAETTFSFGAGVLTVKNGSTTVASLHFAGSSYSTGSFSIISDGHGGSLIGFV